MFGSIHDDASRRDLSINALYYDTENNTLHDFCNGLEDLAERKIRIIGNPPLGTAKIQLDFSGSHVLPQSWALKLSKKPKSQ